MLERGDHMTSIDAKDAFHHLVVNGRFWKFLSFYALVQRDRWITLPMGLTSSPLLWTTIMTEVMKKLRTGGIRLSFYIDDVIIMVNTEDQSIKHTQRVLELFLFLGIQGIIRSRRSLRLRESLTWVF